MWWQLLYINKKTVENSWKSEIFPKKSFFYCKFLKFTIVTEAWNPAIRARSWSQLLWQKSPNSLTLYYSLNHIQEIPAFRDFTIRDPRYFVILFQASISWIPPHFMILKKKKKKNSENFVGFLFFLLFLFIYSDCHLMNINIS